MWVEVRTSHFIVSSDGGEKTARKVLDQFEAVRRVFQATMPNARLNTGIPIRILAARDSKSFAKVFPEFPADNRHIQPNGQFVAGPEKIHIGLRTNVSGYSPYAEIYEDYAHFITKLSYHSLPPWLEEGFTNIYGSMTFTEKGARLGRPDPEDMSTLFESPLLPLDIVLHVDRASPYYNTGQKNTVFSAESRALVHFLFTDSELSNGKGLDRFVDLVEHGGDPLQAARQAFGDLNKLQSRLDSYINLVKGPPAEIAIASDSESTSEPRTLSAAEVNARIGDFWANRGGRDDAQSKLEEALMAEPALAEAEQSLGFLLLKQTHLDEADQHFAKALQLDPNDGLTFYGRGLAAMSRGGFVGVPVAAVEAFEKSASLNPDFAPAWYYLASVYATRTETLQRALADAQRAATLAPGDSGYQLQVAGILERLGRGDEASKTLPGVQTSSNDAGAVSKSGEDVVKAPPRSTPSRGVAGNPPSKSSPSATPHIDRNTEPGEKPSTTPAAPPSASPPAAVAPPPLFSSSAHVYSMAGTITDAICTNAPQIQITLKAQTLVMHLHADDLGQVAVKSSGSTAPAKIAGCTSLRGRSARVSYLLATDKPWDGEIQAVEFRSQP